MMHYESTVVTICDSKGKSLREYNSERLQNGRKSQIYIPFDSEYQILVKNNQDRRIRIDIDIDGSNVTNEGLIISSFASSYIERFLNTAKKFKFVPLSNSGVADPTSSENGIITVSVYREKYVPPVYIRSDPSVWYQTTPFPLTTIGNMTVGGCASDVQYTASRNWVGDNPPLYGGCLRSCSCFNTQPLPPTSSAGATVEGGNSNQTFITTTWAGDDPIVQVSSFKFKLLGTNPQDAKDMQEYLRLKEKFEGA